MAQTEAMWRGDPAPMGRAMLRAVEEGWIAAEGVVCVEGASPWRRATARGDYPLSRVGQWINAGVGPAADRRERVGALLSFAGDLARAGAPLDRFATQTGESVVLGARVELGECCAATLLGHALGWNDGRPMAAEDIRAILALGASPSAPCMAGISPLWMCVLAEDKAAGAAAGAALMEAGADHLAPMTRLGFPGARGWPWVVLPEWAQTGVSVMEAASVLNPELGAMMEAAILGREVGTGAAKGRRSTPLRV